jgi:hypothetical protein
MKNPLGAAVVVAFLASLCACVSVQWTYSVQGPAIAELRETRALGIAVFDPVLQPNDHPLLGVSGAFTRPIDIDGVTGKVALLVLAPDAASKFAVNPYCLAGACLDAWVTEIGTAHRFDCALSNGMTLARVLGQTASGEVVPTGYQAVRAVPQTLRRDVSAMAIRDLCRGYEVDDLLVVEPSVYAEVGQVTDQQSEHAIGLEIDPGNFILRAQVDCRYVLFDGRSGKVITDSARSKAPYDTERPPETWIFDLGLSNPRAVAGFLDGPRFPQMFALPMREAVKPYLTLFRSCVVAVRNLRADGR